LDVTSEAGPRLSTIVFTEISVLGVDLIGAPRKIEVAIQSPASSWQIPEQCIQR
jgi:hypothetical protein